LAVLVPILLISGWGAAPAAAASGGGCQRKTAGTMNVLVCMSFSGRNCDTYTSGYLRPDFYVDYAYPPTSDLRWHVVIQRADGVEWVDANEDYRGLGHYGPYPYQCKSIGPGGTVRTKLQELIWASGSYAVWDTAYSPWLNYP
jgi:hypothetical protein